MSVRITARPNIGIRRVGIFHPAEPVVFPDGFFDEREMEILLKDRDLVVELVEGADLLTPAERRLQLLRNDDGDGSSKDESKEKAAGGSSLADAEPSRSQQSQPDAGHAPASLPSHGLSAEQSAAEGEGLTPLTPTDDPTVTRDLILLLGDYSPAEADVLLAGVTAWTPEERVDVEAYCSAAHLAASDHDDVEVPPMPGCLEALLALIVQRRSSAETANADAKRSGKKKGK